MPNTSERVAALQPEYLKVNDAAKLNGFSSGQALSRWVRRRVNANPELIVRRIHGKIHLGDLRRAMETESRKMTPALAANEALRHANC